MGLAAWQQLTMWAGQRKSCLCRMAAACEISSGCSSGAESSAWLQMSTSPSCRVISSKKLKHLHADCSKFFSVLQLLSSHKQIVEPILAACS